MTFYYAGVVIAPSLVHGGPAPDFFSPAVANYVVQGVQGVHATLASISSYIALKKVINMCMLLHKLCGKCTLSSMTISYVSLLYWRKKKDYAFKLCNYIIQLENASTKEEFPFTFASGGVTKLGIVTRTDTITIQDKDSTISAIAKHFCVFLQ